MSMVVPMNGFGGGANPLNFKVVGGTSAPANPKENTIWVNTSVAVKAWGFVSQKPTLAGAEGAVYFVAETSTNNKTADFNALKKNSIWLNPIEAWQYVSGAWVSKTAKTYQNGKWVDWINYEYLYKDGNQYSNITGGWGYNNGKLYANLGTEISWSATSSNTLDSAVYTKNKIDLSSKTRLIVEKVNLQKLSHLSSAGYVDIGVVSAVGTTTPTFSSKKTVSTVGLHENVELDISSLSGSYYVCIHANATGSSLNGVKLK